jgi:cephalosporin hydroxylase
MGTDARYANGPARAIAEFLAARGGDYEIDERYCDQSGFNVTENPNGYLRRK